VQPVQQYWAGGSAPLAHYAAGSDGPAEADDLLKESGRAWREL
jgi:glucose-6-phosphate 1-dehydrogenase